LEDPLRGWSHSGNLDGDMENSMGLVVFENGYDIKAPYLCCLRLEKYYEWKKRFIEWSRKLEVPERCIRTSYNL